MGRTRQIGVRVSHDSELAHVRMHKASGFAIVACENSYKEAYQYFAETWHLNSEIACKNSEFRRIIPPRSGEKQAANQLSLIEVVIIFELTGTQALDIID